MKYIFTQLYTTVSAGLIFLEQEITTVWFQITDFTITTQTQFKKIWSLTITVQYVPILLQN